MGKKIISFTIDETLLKEWRRYTEKECINSSKLIEKMLQEYLQKRRKK